MNAARLCSCGQGEIEKELDDDKQKRLAWMHASYRKRLNPKEAFDFPQLDCYSTDITEKKRCA